MNDKKHHHDHHHDHSNCGGHHHDHPEEKASTTSAYKNHKQKADETEAFAEDSLSELDAQLQKAQNDAKEYWEMSLRLQAEIQNIQRRGEQNLEKAHKFGVEKFAQAMLPVVDSLEMGLQNSQAVTADDGKLEAIKQGCELTLKMMVDALKKFNIEPIDPLNEPFNPDFHEAMLAQPSDKVAPNTVLNVVQKGYLLNGRVLRPARVIIAKAP